MPFCETNPNCMIYQTAFIHQGDNELYDEDGGRQFGFVFRDMDKSTGRTRLAWLREEENWICGYDRKGANATG